MISNLRGNVIGFSNGELMLDVNGVGYSIFLSKSCAETLPPTGENYSVITYLDVKENSLQLFGFIDTREREMFKMLISVSGIGTKMAHTILSHLSFGEIVSLISGSLSNTFVKIPGIGPKKIELISMTLKDKIFKIDSDKFDSTPGVSGITDSERIRHDALNALLSLGYQRNDAEKIIREILKNSTNEILSTEDLIKRALNFS